MFKKIVLTLAVAVVSASGFLMAQKRQVMLDKVVAVVGGSAILYSDVETYANLLVEQRRAQGYTSDRDPMNEALEALMKQKLLYSQALIDSIELMGDVPSYVEQQIQSMIETAEMFRQDDEENAKKLGYINELENLVRKIHSLLEEKAESLQQDTKEDLEANLEKLQDFLYACGSAETNDVLAWINVARQQCSLLDSC